MPHVSDVSSLSASISTHASQSDSDSTAAVKSNCGCDLDGQIYPRDPIKEQLAPTIQIFWQDITGEHLILGPDESESA